MNTNCLICSFPLGEFELSTEGRVRWHHECQVCTYCKNEVAHELVEKLNLDGLSNQVESLYHQPCHERALMDRWKNKDLPILQEQLDLMNRMLLESRGEINLEIEEIYPLLRHMQQCAANVSIALNRKKDKIKIKDAAAYREHVEIRKENNRVESRNVEEKKARLQAERLDPKLRDRRKALQGLIAMGLSNEQAEAMLARQETPKVQ